jgi:hypothetical protein
MPESITININNVPKSILQRSVKDAYSVSKIKQEPENSNPEGTFGKDLNHIKDHLEKSKEMLWRAVKMNKYFIETEGAMAKHVLMPTLNRDQVVRGTVVGSDQVMSPDGDYDFEIVPDEEYRSVLNYKGKKQPFKLEYGEGDHMIIPEKGKALWAKEGAINTEIKLDDFRRMENQIETLKYLLKKGETPHVEFRGNYTFDPFHQGYVELHPVKEIKILNDPSSNERKQGYDSDPMVKILSAQAPKGSKNAEGELLME